MDKIVSINDLRFSYKHDPVLKSVSFSVAKGGICGLFGPNGSGKTTLFKCMSGLLHYTHGSIAVDGMDVKSAGIKALSKHIAYVPQQQNISFPFTVREVVLMGRTPRITSIFGPSKKDLNAVDEIISAVGIENLTGRICNTLSGGQQQLVYIAKALAQNTPLLFFDEPTSALDFDNQILVWKLLKKIAEAGKTVVVCSHDPNHVLWYTSQVVVLHQGSIVADGRPENVLNEAVLSNIYESKCCIEEFEGTKLIKPVI